MSRARTAYQVEKDKGTEASPGVEEWKSQIKERLMYLDTLRALSHLHLVLMLILLIVGWIISMLLLMILMDQTYSSSFNVSIYYSSLASITVSSPLYG